MDGKFKKAYRMVIVVDAIFFNWQSIASSKHFCWLRGITVILDGDYHSSLPCLFEGSGLKTNWKSNNLPI